MTSPQLLQVQQQVPLRELSTSMITASNPLLALCGSALVLIFITLCLQLQKNLSVVSADGRIQQLIRTEVIGFGVSALVAVTNAE